MPSSKKGAKKKAAPSRRRKTRGRVQITPEKYERMWTAYQKKQTFTSVAAAAGVSRDSARKAIDKGWPMLGLEALGVRLERARREAQRREDYNLIRAMTESLKMVRAVEGRVAQDLKAFLEAAPDWKPEEVKTLQPAEVQVHVRDSVALIERLAKLKSYLLGGPESREELQIPGEEDFKRRASAWSDEQLAKYILTGEEPPEEKT